MKLIVLLGIILSGAVYAQQDSIHAENTLVFRFMVAESWDSVTVSFNSSDSLEFHVDWKAEGSLKNAEGFLYNDRKEGWWVRYHEDGVTPKMIAEYHNNRPSGLYYKVYSNGILKEKGEYNRGHYVGELVRYYASGCVKFSGQRNDDGKEQGMQTFYFDCATPYDVQAGQIEFQYEAIDNLPVGTAYRYYPSGNLLERITYDSKGVPVKSESFEDEPMKEEE